MDEGPSLQDEKVPRYELCSHFKFECEVSHVVNPSRFWIRARPCIAASIEEQLLDRLRQMSHSEQILRDPVIGQYCSAPYRDQLRRGRILSLKRSETGQLLAKVLYIDYGESAWISSDILCVLPELLYTFQWQAVLCRLYGVVPKNSLWNDEIVNKFKELCDLDDLFLIGFDNETPNNHFYTVQLFRQTSIAEGEDKRDESFDSILIAQFPDSLLPSTSVPVERFKQSSNIPNEPEAINLDDWQTRFNYLNLAPNYEPEEDQAEPEPENYGPPTDDRPRFLANRDLVYRSGHSEPIIKRCYNIPVIDFSSKVDADQFLNLNIGRVISPDCFYVIPVDSNADICRKDAQEFTKFTRELSTFYSEKLNCVPIDYSTVNSSPYAAAQLEDDDGGDAFFRCQVLGPASSAPPAFGAGENDAPQMSAVDIRQFLRVRVFYIDLGREEVSKPASEVFLLDERFSHYPSRILKCCLFATRPVTEGTSSGFLKWSDEAVNVFKKFIKHDGPMKATVLLNETNRIGVALYAENENNRAVVVNHEMVRLNYARSDIQWVSYVSDKLDRLNALLAEPWSGQNPSTVRDAFTDDFVRAILCPTDGAVQPVVSTRPQDRGCGNHLEPPDVDSIVYVEIHTLYSCVRFSVTFPEGVVDNIRKQYEPLLLTHSMAPIHAYEEYKNNINNQQYSSRLCKFLRPPTIGEYCLARFREDGKLYRAKILQYNEEDLDFQVKFLDYGNTDWLTLNEIFVISTDDLTAVPFMALECRLANLRLNADGDSTLNTNSLWELISNRTQKITVIDVRRDDSGTPFLTVDLRVMDSDGSYINVNDLVVNKGWAQRSP